MGKSKDKGNPHLHILSTTRAWEGETFSKVRFVIEREKLIEIRHQAAEITNEFGREKGYNYQVDARSYAERGLNITPMRHLGPNAHHKLLDKSRIAHENNEAYQRNIQLLFDHPEELIKLVASKKVVFTSTDLEREIFKRVGGDMHLYSLLKTRLLESELLQIPLIDTQLETQEVPPHRLNISNDNVSLKGEELKADFDEAIRSYTHHLLVHESVIEAGKNLKEEAVFTTKEAIELEQNTRSAVQQLCASTGKEISSDLREEAIIDAEYQNKFEFSEEQKQAIAYLLDPHQLRILKGNAGTGKTTVLKPVVEAYEAAGYLPLGVAFQGKVSELLGHDLGIPAYTLDQLQKRWKRYDKLQETIPTLKGEALRVAKKELEKLAPFQLNERNVVVLDEGNMVEGRHWQELLSRIQKAGAHLRVVQDNKQIKALFGLDISRLVEDTAGHFELKEVHRQKEPWMRAASAHLNDHNLLEGFKPYEEHGCLTFKDSINSTRYALAEAYVNNLEKAPDEFHIALAFQNRDVEDLNDAIRHQLKQRGSLGAEMVFEGKEFAVGDRIVFTENDHTGWFVKTLTSLLQSLTQKFTSTEPQKGVKNGTFGQIEALDEKQNTLDVRLLKDNRVVRVNLKTYNDIDYGYAMTVNKAEGQTFDWVYGLFDPLMNANNSLIWMTRHRFGFQGFISKDHASNINDMATAAGKSDYRPLISDFNTQGSPEAELLKEYLKTAYEAGNLWGTISKENPDTPFDHSEWADFQAAQYERNHYAEEILKSWELCQTFANQAGIKKITLEIQAGLKDKPLSEVEIDALQRVESYRSIAYQARTLWDNLSKTEKHTKTSLLLKDYEELAETRNHLAYEIVSFPQLHRPFFKIIKREDAFVSYGGEVYEKIPVSLKTAEKHAQAYMKSQQQKAFATKLTSIERGAFHELIVFKKHALDCGRFAATIKAEDPLRKEASSLTSALEQSSKERDFLAFKIIKFYDKYSPLLERADVSQDQLLKHAVFGEVRQLALKHSLAKTIEKRLEFADQLHRMVGEGDKLDKPLFGILKGMGVDFSRLKFEQGCLRVMKQGEGTLPFKTVEELVLAFVSLNEYRTVHQEAAKNWHLIKTQAIEKVTTLQDGQIVSLNTWMKTSSSERKENQQTTLETNVLVRKALEKASDQVNTKKSKSKDKEISQNLQGKDNVTIKEPANTQTLSLVTRELTRVVNSYAAFSSENLPSTNIPQDIQARQAELLHLQSHLRKGDSGYLRIFKMEHAENKTWEKLRERKISLAGQVLEKCGEVIKVSFGHDYARMQKEAYEHQMGQLASRYQEANREEKAALAAELLSHLDQDGYRGVCTKTQLKTQGVNFEALHLYGLFHASASKLQEKGTTLTALETYIYNQERFSSLWKPRCEAIEKELGSIKEEFALHREQVLSSLEDLNSARKNPDQRYAFALDRLINETHALIVKNKSESQDHHKQNHSEQNKDTLTQPLEIKVQEKLQHLGASLELTFNQETLKLLSHEVINLSHKREEIHEQRLKIMKRIRFENDAEFFDSARNRNEAAFNLIGTPLGKVIEESKHIFLIEDYADRYRSKLEKTTAISPYYSSDKIRQSLSPSSCKWKTSEGLPLDDKSENFILQNTHPFIEAKVVEEALKQDMASFADDIFSSLGESHNRPMSTSMERRYGKKGKYSVDVQTGRWRDWSQSDMFGKPLDMLTKLKGFSFKEAVDYGASWAGIMPERIRPLKQFPQKALHHPESEREKYQRETQQKKKKIEKAQAQWNKGQPIQGTVAARYLREHRKIRGKLSKDLRFLPSFTDKNSGKAYPCLMAAARSPTGEVTAVQLTSLDPKTAMKANVAVAKRSLGSIKGSFVNLQQTHSQVSDSRSSSDKSSNLLFVAEGVETALSLKEAGIRGTIQASLGLFNLAQIESKEPRNKHIVICADHDSPGSQAFQTLEKSVVELKYKGFQVTVVKPDKLEEDFNDVLKQYGPRGVREILQRHLLREIFVQKPNMAIQKETSFSDEKTKQNRQKDSLEFNPYFYPQVSIK